MTFGTTSLEYWVLGPSGNAELRMNLYLRKQFASFAAYLMRVAKSVLIENSGAVLVKLPRNLFSPSRSSPAAPFMHTRDRHQIQMQALSSDASCLAGKGLFWKEISLESGLEQGA